MYTLLFTQFKNRITLFINILLIYVLLQEENMELKQSLSKSNWKISVLIANQDKYPEKINLVTSTMNYLQV